MVLTSRKNDPNCSSQDPDLLPIPDPRGQKGTGSRIRIRNTGIRYKANAIRRLEQEKKRLEEEKRRLLEDKRKREQEAREKGEASIILRHCKF
jgi:hypothetical protein